MLYRINSPRRLCSTTSAGDVPKSSSSPIIREMRSSTLSATRAVSCKLVRKVISRRTLETDLVMGINSRNGSQDRFEHAGLLRWIVCVVYGSGGSLVRRSPVIPPWN